MTEKKAKVGRPSLYKPEYCQVVMDMGREGKSFAQMAAALDIDKDTLYHWRTQHEEFSVALSRARTYAQAWWETKGQDGLSNRDINPGMYKIAMAARFPDDYSDRSKVELTGANGGPIKSEVTMTPDEAYKALLNG